MRSFTLRQSSSSMKPRLAGSLEALADLEQNRDLRLLLARAPGPTASGRRGTASRPTERRPSRPEASSRAAAPPRARRSGPPCCRGSAPSTSTTPSQTRWSSVLSRETFSVARRSYSIGSRRTYATRGHGARHDEKHARPEERAGRLRHEPGEEPPVAHAESPNRGQQSPCRGPRAGDASPAAPGAAAP